MIGVAVSIHIQIYIIIDYHSLDAPAAVRNVIEQGGDALTGLRYTVAQRSLGMEKVFVVRSP